ncbi:MAG TPA: arginase family protein [Rectinemataceae bacterium]|nr:arginase family protein [Rectinemataceae bacterium]
MTVAPDLSRLSRGDVVLLGIPADDKASYRRGAAAAPGAIREALRCDSSNMTAEDGRDLGSCARLKDAGDLELQGRLDCVAIEAASEALAGRGAHPLFLGGDHAVSFPLIAAQARRWGPMTVLHIDAHPDLYDEFAGDRLSHACPFARLLEAGAVSRLVQVGIRGMNAVQRTQALRFKVEVLDMVAWRAGRRPQIDGEFYLSLDLDALDPSCAPGVSHREPGGLLSSELIGLLQGVGGRLIGADLVEYNPERDWDGLSGMVAAKLVKELAARILRDSE